MVRCQETAVPPRHQPLAIVQVGREPPNPEGVDAGSRKLEARAEIPSSFRQMSATIGAFTSLSSISPEVIAARSMNDSPRTALRNPLFSLRSAPNVRPPPRSIPPVRPHPSERGAHPGDSKRLCNRAPDPSTWTYGCWCRAAATALGALRLAISWLSYGPPVSPFG